MAKLRNPIVNWHPTFGLAGTTTTTAPAPAPAPTATAPPPADTSSTQVSQQTYTAAPADEALIALFTANGLPTLATAVVTLVQQGLTGAALSLALQDTPEYHQRFAANDERKKKGLPVLSPADYLSAEAGYRQVMTEAGLPAGFYDDQSDFEKFIANDTSVAEVKSRVDDAVNLSKKTDPGYRQMLLDTFGIGLTDGDIAAFFLDQDRAMPLLDKDVQAVGIADAARRQGLTYSEQRAMQLTEAGVTGAQADQAYGQIADATATYGKAGSAFGLEYDQATAEDEALLNDAQAKRKRQSIETAFSAENPSGSSRTVGKRDTSGSY